MASMPRNPFVKMFLILSVQPVSLLNGTDRNYLGPVLTSDRPDRWPELGVKRLQSNIPVKRDNVDVRGQTSMGPNYAKIYRMIFLHFSAAKIVSTTVACVELSKIIPFFSLVTLKDYYTSLAGWPVLSLSIIHVRRDVLTKLMPDTVVMTVRAVRGVRPPFPLNSGSFSRALPANFRNSFHVTRLSYN